jgi:hypothetical protein
MSTVSRRNFLTSAGSFALAAAMPLAKAAHAAMGPDDKFDLVIKGGDVLDPSQSLRDRRDIGIRRGLTEAVEGDISAARALHVLDAGGNLVTPGLVDLHTHVYPYGSAIGSLQTSLSPTSAQRLACRRAMRGQTILRLSAVTSQPRRAPGSMPLSTSPIWGWRLSRWRSSITSILRRWTRARGRSRRTPTWRSA